MFKLLNKIYIIGVLCVAATPVFARVCFLPDGNCEAGKATYSPTNNVTGCEYKDEPTVTECQTYYQSGFCYYKKCKMSETECMKEAHEASHAKTGTKKKCVVCKDGCWKLEDSVYGPDTEHTCKEMGYKIKENCKADYVKFKPVNLIDKNGNQCGVCENLTCSQMGGYKTKASCNSNEEFESVNKIDAYGNTCGNCKAKAEPDSTPEPQTCNISNGEYDSQRACETNHPDTICTENSTSKCWIGKCDTQNNKYYYETKDVCYERYQDECYDCNINPCEQVDEDSNCWFMDCEKMGFYSSETACKAKSTNCRFEDGLGCYMPDDSKPDDTKCDEKQGLFATEVACSNFGLLGPADCTKEGNCYRPDVFRISAGWRYDHCGQNAINEWECVDYGKFIFTATNNAQRQYTLVNDTGKEIEIRAGSYTIKTTGVYTQRESFPLRFCHTFYINQLEMGGSDDSVAHFDPLNYGDEQDLEQNNYAMNGTLKEDLFGYNNGGCKISSNYYEYNTQAYEFKGGVTYYIDVFDTTVNCTRPGYGEDCVK